MFSPLREKLNTIFAIEKLENSNYIVNAFANFEIMTVNDVRYVLTTVTASDVPVEFVSNPDGSTHTNNGITHQNLLSSHMIGI